MSYSTAYSQHMYSSPVLDYRQKFDWLDHAAQKRGEMDEMAYKYIDSLKNKALNIRFLNQTAQKKVDDYNVKIDNFFKDKDLSKVDLADFRTANSYTKLFDEIASDDLLNKSYQVDKQIQSTLNSWKEAAKNPSKTGYNVANHNVWTNEHLMPYVQETDMTKIPTFNSGNYDPEYDYQKELNGLKGQVHFDGKKMEITDGQGNKRTIDNQYITPEKLHTFFKGALSGKAVNQMITEAKSGFYNYYNNIPDSQKDQVALGMYEKDKSTYQEYQNKYSNKIAELEGKIKASSPEAQIELQREKEELQQELENFKFFATPKDYISLSKVGLANRYAGTQVENKLSKLAKGMSYQIEKITNSADDVYWKRQNFNFDVNKEQYDRNRDAVKDNQWEKTFAFNQQKEANDIALEAAKLEIDKTKANALGSKAAKKVIEKSNGFFNGEVEGDVQSGVVTVDSVNEDLNKLDQALKIVNPETLTVESVKAMVDNQDNSPVGRLIRTHALQASNDGRITQEMLGVIKTEVKNSLENGDLHNYFNDLKIKQRHLVEIKNSTWNNITRNIPAIQGKNHQEIQNYFNNNPSLAKTVKESWNRELTSKMMSIKGNNLTVDLTKDKDNGFKNADTLANIVNGNKDVLNQLGVPEGKGITKDMISAGTYSPITKKMKITFNSNAVKSGSGLEGSAANINNTTISVDVPETIRKQFDVDISPKEELFEQSGYIDGKWKNASYKITKDLTNDGYKHFVIHFEKDNQYLKSTGSWVDGKYVKPAPSNASVEEIEQYIKQYIDNRE